MNKQRASGRKDGYARISGLADICERPHMSMKGFLRRMSKKTGSANVWSIARAPKREAMRGLFIHVYKQRASGRKDGYARISGLADICERLNAQKEGVYFDVDEPCTALIFTKPCGI